MKSLSRWFMNGLLTVIPLSGTVLIVWWLASWAENIFGGPLKQWLGLRADEAGGYYFYGLGLAALVVFMIFLGFCLEFYLGKLFFTWSERLVERIPGIKLIYSSIKEIIAFFTPGKDRSTSNYMVVVTVAPGIRFVGYVTRDSLDDVKGDIGGRDDVVVVLPFCYQMGGNTIIVPRHMVRRIDMTFEEGMKLALSGFVITAEKNASPPAPAKGAVEKGESAP